ncbi:SDR family NAD(P)-dependent oxidoreductase [Streptomyces albus]|uniref:SDR family NAD(P)-dependent oxidoreductase n=1 Tax=Streptomyces sp. NRRL F-5917 TaxID=1463873 RepID=UPI00099D5C99|nr:SDR family oxidoreductase [Streptomyces sp. NRRL F-5917]
MTGGTPGAGEPAAGRASAVIRLDDPRTVLVTGASGGIGRGIALRFAAGGAAVAVHYRGDAAGARETVALIEAEGGTACALHGDLASEEGCRGVVEEAAHWRPAGLGALVNNAGVQPVEALPGMSEERWRAVMDTNVLSVFGCTQAAAPLLAAGGGGSVTHVASIEAAQPAPGHAHYAAAKAAVVAHARAAALEYGPSGVRVNTVSPGLVRREGIEEQWPEGVRRWLRAAPDGRLGTAEEVGDACVFLASGAARWINGHDLVLDGGVTAGPSW